jgi:glycosyltransferase involved in cell wall biosynthesis
MKPLSVGVLTVVPSPYQRDLFAAMRARTDLDLSVWYMEANAPDSPWPAARLEPWEKILPGGWFPLGSARIHWNWNLPDWTGYDAVICNSLVSLTAQRFMRGLGRRTPWVFWGEQLRNHPNGIKKCIQEQFCAPLVNARAIVAVGKRASQDYERRVNSGPRHVSIPYYCDLEPFQQKAAERRPSGEITFLFCGQMIPRKGIDLVLEAFARVVQQGITARLLLVGREAQLETYMSEIDAEVKKQIEYAGFQPPEKLPHYFARADVLLLPSRYEGWGVVVNQAIGAGLAVICTQEVGAGVELVEEGVNGYRIATATAALLAEKMEFLTRNPDICQKMGEASIERAREWMPAVGAARWAALLREIVQGK